MEYYYIGDTNKKQKSKKDDEAFKTILRRVETEMSKKILTTMYWAIKKMMKVLMDTISFSR